MTADSVPAPVTSLSGAQARRAGLRAQGLLGVPDRRAGVDGVLAALGAVQLDTISVLARSHELVAYSRLGGVGREHVEQAYWSGETAFEYWAHAACVLPMTEWPWFAFRRRHYAARQQVWHAPVSDATTADILARLAAEGPLTATQLGGAKRGSDWWDWSDVKIAVEFLLATGAVVCTRRSGWRRVYDLPERAVPAELLAVDADDHQCLVRLVEVAGRCLGVADEGDLADYFRLRREQVAAAVDETSLVPVAVDGWSGRAWAHPQALATLDARGRHRTTLLSPFDSLVWDRRRTARLFGFTHSLEAYVPRAKRVHGYFAMPLLAGGELLGRVDPRRSGRTLVAAQLTLDRASAVGPFVTALREAAEWVGCDSVVAERVLPEPLAPVVHAALAAV